MRLTRLFVILLLATAQTAFGDDWLSHYYEHPTPERFVPEVRNLSKSGTLSNPNTAALISVFLGRVMAANPAEVEGWLQELGDLKGGDRQTILAAARFSGTKEAQAYIEHQPDAAQFRGAMVDVRSLEPDNPTILDMLWADFFATGDAAPIRRVILALNDDKYSGAIDRYSKSDKTETDRHDAILEAVFKAARWSLESNARQYPRVGKIIEHIYFSDRLTQPEKLWLSLILAKAMPEKYEMSKSETGQWVFKQKGAAQGEIGLINSDSKPAGATDSTKSKDGFGGSVLATVDEDWQKKWNTPPEVKPNFNMADVVPYGKKVYILIFFANPKLDQQGNANVRCDVKILTPKGQASFEKHDMACYGGAIQGSPYAMRLSAPVIGFSGDPGDPPGVWTIEVTLRDAVRDLELPLRTKFELKQP